MGSARVVAGKVSPQAVQVSLARTGRWFPQPPAKGRAVRTRRQHRLPIRSEHHAVHRAVMALEQMTPFALH